MVNRFASGLAGSLSASVKEKVPAEKLSDLSHNPQALLNPDALASLRESLSQIGPQVAEVAEQLLVAMRSSLASSIGDLFVVTLAMTVVALVVTAFLKEVPLRGYKSQGT
jgi:hypothetical protein